MKKIALMFPGQGSQIIGMGRDLYDKYSKAKEIIDLAGDELKRIIFYGPEDILRLTKYAQPAVFTVSLAAFEVFRELYDISDCEFVAVGHSLGEYSALCSAGFFEFINGLAIVKARGKFMQEVSEEKSGIMAAIIGMRKSVIEDICKNVLSFGVCEAVNFNSPEQVVISGTSAAVNKAIELAMAAGAIKAIILNVSGPFHSSLMLSASDNIAKELNKYNFNLPTFGVYTNCDALLTTDVSIIKEKLIKQIKSPVRWDESIQNIIKEGFDRFIEFGPGKILSGFLRRIDKSKRALNIEDSMSLEKTLEELGK